MTIADAANPADAHHALLAANHLTPVLHAPEVIFTGMLMSCLINRSTQTAALTGLGLPSDLTVTGSSATVNPIDLAIIAHDPWGDEHVVLIEVKGRFTPLNAPGYRHSTSKAYKTKNLGKPSNWDDAPSQLDRAHQIVGTWLRQTEVGCSHCGYPQTCPHHECLRGCSTTASAPTWTGLPKTYPFKDDSTVDSLATFVKTTTAYANNWHYLFLDYRDRDPTSVGSWTCHAAWNSAPMSTLADTLWKDYLAREDTDPVRHAYASLLQVIYTSR